MGSFVLAFELVELFGTLIMTKQQVEIEVLKKKIKDVVESHQQEFKSISEIDKLFKVLGTNAVLTEALSQTNDICQLNWKVIADNLSQKVKIMNDLTSQYKSVDLTKYQFSLKDGFNLGMSIVGSGMLLNNFSKSLKPGPNPDQTPINKLKSGMQQEKILKSEIILEGNPPSQLKPGEIEIPDQFAIPKGSVKGAKSVQVSGNIESSLSAPKKSILYKISRYGSKLGKAVLGVIRVIGLLALVYGIYQNEKQIINLVSEYREAVNEFGSGGKFKKNEVQILNTIAIIAELFSNLAYASYAAVNQISNSYLICGLTFSSHSDYFLKQADRYTPKLLGFDVTFCQASQQFFKKISSYDVNESSTTQQFQNTLQDAHQTLKNFLHLWDPMQKYTTLVNQFVNYNTTSSLLNKDAFVNEYLVNDFKKKILKTFEWRNLKLKDFEDKLANGTIDKPTAIEKKRNTDISLVKGLTIEYLNKIYFNVPDKVELDIDYDDYDDIKRKFPKDHLERFGSIILSFTNQIYCESDAGDKLFGEAVSDYKSKKSYLQFVQETEVIPNILPLPFEDANIEKDELEKMRVIIRQLISSKKMADIYDKQLYSITSESLVVHMFILKDKITINNQKVDKIEFRRGTIVKCLKVNDNSSEIFIITKPENGDWIIQYE